MNYISLLRKICFVLSFFVTFSSTAQITVTNDAPYDSPIYLIDSLLLGSGVVASNHQFQGDPLQIGFFNGILSNIGLDSGIVMSTGDISLLVPPGGGFGGNVNSNADDPDLLTVANSVPDLIGQNFSVTSVNDVVILEFDFVPTSSFLSFKYVFASQEYFAYENTQFNDVFGFFISGPGIVGPFASPVAFPGGSINIATIPDSDPELPITISSVNADLNSNLFVNNQALETVADADGFTTVITAEAEVQCGETYHIRLSIADGSDTGLSSYVFLDAGSFTSPQLQVINSLEIDSNKVFTDCGVDVDLTADIDGNYDFVWNTGSDEQTITVGPGSYWVEATDETGCAVNSDTIVVYSQPIPEISFSNDTILCTGDLLTIESNVTNGTLPYTFDWSNGSDDENLIVGSGDQYTLTVIDSNGCMDTDIINITEYGLPELSYVPEEIIICGGNPVEVSAFGAQIYSWSPNTGLSSTNSQIVNMSSAASITYTLTGIDTNGCVNSIEVPTTSANGFEIEVYTNPVSCQGIDDGTVTIITGNGATTPVSYSIYGGDSLASFSVFENLPFGTYDIFVEDALGCALIQEATIESAQEPIQVITGAQDVICNGEDNGLVFVQSITGGEISSGGYDINWFSSTSPNMISSDTSVSVPAGSYYLIIRDDNGCEANDQIIVQEPYDLNLNVQLSDVSCFDAEDGAINLTVMGGGTPPYQYNWVNYGGADSPSLFNLSAGVYQLEITDSNGCIYNYEYIINSPSQPLMIESTSSMASCYGENSGSASVVVSGGNQPYFYNWSSGHVTPNVEQLMTGDYTVNVTDASGCSASEIINVDENPQIFTDISSVANSCYGYADGSASISANGGVGLLSYLWSNQSQQSSQFGLSFGNYWVITEDEIGCKVTDTVFISQPSNIRIILNSSDVLCNGDSTGQIVANVNGGTPYLNNTYTYTWLLTGDTIGFNSPNIYNLPASQLPYELLVTDYNNCSSNGFTFVGEPEELRLDTSELVPAYCEDIATGKVTVIAEGGFLNTSSEYQFSWNNGNQTSMLTNYVSGEYVSYVEDDNGCVDSLVIEIPLISTFESQMDSIALNCFEDNSGQAEVTLQGGYGPYTYNFNWIGGSEQIVINSESFLKSSLPSGITSVVVSDVNGCSIADQTLITQPAQLYFDVVKENDESCSGDISACDGQITINSIGGSGNYNYQWLDLNGNLIDSLTTESTSVLASNLCSGLYLFEVIDDRGCVAINSGNGQPTPLEIVAGYNVYSSIDNNSYDNNIECYGDTAAFAAVLNPNPLFQYDWYVNGEFYDSGIESNLTAGSISLMANYLECNTLSEEFIINQPSATVVLADLNNVSCNGESLGSILVEVVNQQGTLLNWSNGDQTNYISSLSAGQYDLVVTNNIGCETLFTYQITEPDAMQVTADISAVSCNGADDGEISISVNGGQAPYDIDWQGQDPFNMSAGEYTVVITDANSCVLNANIEIDEPSTVSAFFSDNPPFNANGNGGTPPYTFEWLYFGYQVSTGLSFTPLQNGTYTLVATDANGCEGSITLDYNGTVNIEDPNLLSFNIYPNPMRDFFTIDSYDSSSEIEFSLIDSRGRVIRKQNFVNSLTVNRGNLATGLYTISLKSKLKNLKTKLFIYE